VGERCRSGWVSQVAALAEQPPCYPAAGSSRDRIQPLLKSAVVVRREGNPRLARSFGLDCRHIHDIGNQAQTDLLPVFSMAGVSPYVW
jgi:hypothetical protein